MGVSHKAEVAIGGAIAVIVIETLLASLNISATVLALFQLVPLAIAAAVLIYVFKGN